jgi:hypothetical protein
MSTNTRADCCSGARRRIPAITSVPRPVAPRDSESGWLLAGSGPASSCRTVGAGPAARRLRSRQTSSTIRSRPRRHGSLAAEAGRLPEGRDHGVLDGVAGLVGITEHADRNGPSRSLCRLNRVPNASGWACIRSRSASGGPLPASDSAGSGDAAAPLLAAPLTGVGGPGSLGPVPPPIDPVRRLS